MKKKVLFSISIIIILFVIIYVENGIKSFDMRFYQSKDNGYFLRFEIVCISSFLFYLFFSKSKKFLFAFYGLLIGVICSMFWYLINVPDILFSFVCLTTSISILFIFNYYKFKS